MAARTLSVGGHPVRVLEAGSNAARPPVVFFAGLGGLPGSIPFLDRLAESARVLAPSLPGHPGAEHFRHLDSVFDWALHAVETVEALGEGPVDLIGSSVGGALAAEVAALAGGLLDRLVLISPFGIFDEADPGADIWAQPPGPDSIPSLVCERPENWKKLWQAPSEGDQLEWQVMSARAIEASARLLFPFGDTGVEKRLHRVGLRTLMLRGEHDRVLPPGTVDRFAAAIAGPVQSAVVEGSGHLPELDAPDTLAAKIDAFLADGR